MIRGTSSAGRFDIHEPAKVLWFGYMEEIVCNRDDTQDDTSDAIISLVALFSLFCCWRSGQETSEPLWVQDDNGVVVRHTHQYIDLYIYIYIYIYIYNAMLKRNITAGFILTVRSKYSARKQD